MLFLSQAGWKRLSWFAVHANLPVLADEKAAKCRAFAVRATTDVLMLLIHSAVWHMHLSGIPVLKRISRSACPSVSMKLKWRHFGERK